MNIGNSDVVKHTDFIEAIEETTGLKAARDLIPMQAGDATVTWADTSLLKSLMGYQPKTNAGDGMKAFVECYHHYTVRK